MGPTQSEGNQHCCHGSSLQQVPSCPRSLWGLHPPPWLKAARWLRGLHAHAQPPDLQPECLLAQSTHHSVMTRGGGHTGKRQGHP